MRKIGIYGGSFNPIHNGHISVARYVLESLKLDKLLIVPVGKPSHKEFDLEKAEERLKMCELAFQNDERIEILDIEVKEKGISYTYDTLLKIKKIYPNAQIYEIIGEDSSESFEKWKNYKEILKESKLVVLKREGYEQKIYDRNILVVENPNYNYSSTQVRERLKNRESIENLVPLEVMKYIERNGLYKKR